ncbi:MAG: M23 family metallopeptidase [Anaerolineae bacterium]|nr:M23 family metallopeptidase [Anaerolineae bacterium]
MRLGQILKTGNDRDAAALLLALLALLLLILAACQPNIEAAAPATVAAAAEAPQVASPTSPPPLVAADAATATALPSFALLPAATATVAAPDPTVTIASMGMAPVTATVAVTGTPGVSPTAGPTFTPPPPPDDSPDHFWFRRPVAEGSVWTDKHYPYGSTLGGALRTHHGVEFNVSYNTSILAVAAGTVRVAASDDTTAYGPHTNFYGNLVVIEHDYTAGGQPLFSLYGHLNQVLVSEGQQVAAGAVIGLSGATGVADGPHVHLEVRVGANSYDHTRNPLLWIYPFPDRGAIAGRVTWPNGEPARQVGVSVRRVDGPNPYQATTTYADDSVNPDPFWQENFVIDDVTAGYYEVAVNTGEKRIKVETWVHPYQTSFVEIVLP